MYLSQNPAVPVRAMLFPLDFVRIDWSVYIQTAQEKLYRFDFMTTAQRSGIGAQGWDLPGQSISHSFAKHFSWVARRST